MIHQSLEGSKDLMMIKEVGNIRVLEFELLVDEKVEDLTFAWKFEDISYFISKYNMGLAARMNISEF
jgi:hypothetical protein